jgi:hypothetical protein
MRAYRYSRACTRVKERGFGRDEVAYHISARRGRRGARRSYLDHLLVSFLYVGSPYMR